MKKLIKNICYVKVCYLLLYIICSFTPNIFASGRCVVSVIFSSSLEPYQEAWNGFNIFFKEKNIVLLSSEYNIEKESFDKISQEITEKKPDIIFVIGTSAAKLARDKFQNIPIVFCMVLNPEPIKASNVTGVLMEVPVSKKLSMIRELMPKANKIGMFYSPESINKYKEISDVCQQMGFNLFEEEIKSKTDIPTAITKILQEVDCFIITSDSDIFFLKSVENLLLEGLRNKIAIFGLSASFTKAGALLSLECDYNSIGKQSAEIALRIINGEKPSEISVEDPIKTRLSLNMLVAERLSIEIPSQIKKETNKIFGEKGE
ncbi:MAG: ABC transporter substrate-binding protein [Elusimicrobia bacterium]|nr:ABC transporter substrate-binding protein [Elusimicrobiota bacterium]